VNRAPNDLELPPVVIAAKELSKSFGSIQAVKDLSLSVDAGNVLGLLGPNGAGKTTTINMLTTLTSIDDGRASICGFDVETQPNEVRQLIGLAGQSAAVDDKLTARENLRLFGRLYKIGRSDLRQRVEELIDQFRMNEFADRQVATYSGGERRRLDVVAALVAKPPALFLDEPTTGLDPRSRVELWQAIEILAAGGTAIVLTTQYLEEADRLADEIVMIDGGVAVATGTPDQLKKDLERDVLEIRLASDEALTEAVNVVGEKNTVAVDRDLCLLQIGVTDAAANSVSVLRALDEAGVPISDFQLRRPTLDDVFLTLTAEGPSGAVKENTT
jgi:ABC-2 type transport system ATP-binding protein